MGKKGKWFKKFLTGNKEKDNTEKGTNEPTSTPSRNRLAPSPKEKRRWSFRRTAAERKELVEVSAPETDNEQKRHEMGVAVATVGAADAAVAAAQAAAAVVHLTAATDAFTKSRAVEEAAAIKIQACFRSYLARKALCALKGLVKLQALVRGHLVRRQATETLRRMQSLVSAQARARAQRIHMVEEAQGNSQRQTNHRTSPQNPRVRQSYEAARNAEENIKIVEMDLAIPRSSSKSRNSYYIPQTDQTTEPRHSTHHPGARTPYKADIHQYSPSPSAHTDISPKARSGHFEEFSFATARSSPQYFSAMTVADPTHTSMDYPFFPNYMSNTKSSRAKVRSQSTPRQRLDSYDRQSSRQRNIPRGIKMERSSSQAGYQFPLYQKLDGSNISHRDSTECGSTSTVLTVSNYY